MSQSGYTPILIYASGTATNVPLAANLTSSASGAELALNYADGKLYYKNSSGTVTLLASAAGSLGDVVGPASATDNALARFDLTTGKLIQNSVGILSDAGILTGLTGITSSGSITFSSLTSGRVPYATTAGLLTDSANLLYSGTDLTVYGLTVGRGAGAINGNTTLGNQALTGSNTGTGITAIGYTALATNTSGTNNTAAGFQALVGNTSGSSNTAFGTDSLVSNTSANSNTAVGYQAGYTNTTGSNNTNIGYQAGYTNPSSGTNVFVGYQAGYAFNAVGQNSANAFIGYSAGSSVTSGLKNTIIGSYSGNQGGLDIRTASNYIVLSDGDGTLILNAQKDASIALQGAITKAGAGITFPATQSASSDANTLDDYEEGTFNITMTPSVSGSITMNLKSCKYTKIGRVVHINALVTLTSVSAPVGTISFGNLPFVAGANSADANGWSTMLISDNLSVKTKAYINAGNNAITYSLYDDGPLTITSGWDATLSCVYSTD